MTVSEGYTAENTYFPFLFVHLVLLLSTYFFLPLLLSFSAFYRIFFSIYIHSKLANKFHHVRPFCLLNFLVIMFNYNIIHPLSFNIERFERQISIACIDVASTFCSFFHPFDVSRRKKKCRVSVKTSE